MTEERREVFLRPECFIFLLIVLLEKLNRKTEYQPGIGRSGYFIEFDFNAANVRKKSLIFKKHSLPHGYTSSAHTSHEQGINLSYGQRSTALPQGVILVCLVYSQQPFALGICNLRWKYEFKS